MSIASHLNKDRSSASLLSPMRSALSKLLSTGHILNRKNSYRLSTKKSLTARPKKKQKPKYTLPFDDSSLESLCARYRLRRPLPLPPPSE